MSADETAITLTFDNGTMIPAKLNGTLAARNLVAMLPLSRGLERSTYDYCGTSPSVDFDPDEVQAGWQNGDIGYANGWLALFFAGEEQSETYTSEMIVGQMDAGYLSALAGMGESPTVTLALA
jgi:hypothetical protein